jgi:hypothetical protein
MQFGHRLFRGRIMTRTLRELGRDEQGVAMVLAVLLLLLVTGVGIAAINHAGSETAMTGSARRTLSTFFAADAGIHVAINQLARPTPDLNPFTLNLGQTTIRSGTRADAVAQPIVAAGSGPPPDGYGINQGSGFRSRMYRANVTALYPNAGASELDAKFGRLEVGNGGY